MKERSAFNTFLRYLLPSLFGMVLVSIYTFTDTFVVGRALGSVALGAMGVCTPPLTCSYALGFLCGMGGGALYSMKRGECDREGANRIYTTSLLMLMIIGFALAIAGNVFARPFAFLLGADENNIVYAMPYLRCILTYIPGFMFDVFIMTYMKNDGHPNVAMIATVTGTTLNILLDFLFVFGFNWGMTGAAIATCIGSGTCSFINIVYIAGKKLLLIPRLSSIRPALIPEIFTAGVSVCVLECSAGVVTFVFIVRATEIYGTVGASIYTIIMNWTLIAFTMLMGVGQAAQPLISLSKGRGSLKDVRIYRRYLILFSMLAGLLYLVVGYLFTEGLVSVFTRDDMGMVDMTISCFRLYLPSYFLMTIAVSIGLYFQAIGLGIRSFILMLSRGIALPVIYAFLLPAIFGAAALWLAVPAAELTAALAAVGMLACTAGKQLPVDTIKE